MARFFFIVLAVLTCRAVTAQDLLRWYSASGKTLEAKLIEQDRKTVTLETADGRKVTVEKSRLDKEQVTETHLRWLREQDRAQYELTAPHLENFGHAPDATVDVLLSLHREFETAPYAGLAAGVLVACEQNKPKPADRILRSVIERIGYQRRFDESVHEVTMASAVNDLAVCLIKQKKADQAAAQITALCEQMKTVPLAAHHNATLLQNLSANAPFMSLRPAAKVELLRAVSTHPGEREAEHLPDYFVYSLANDLPALEKTVADPEPRQADAPPFPVDPQADKRASAVELRLYSDHWCLLCDGRGIVGCSNRGCANGKIPRRASVQVGFNPNTREPIFANKIFHDPCGACRGRGKLRCGLCKDGKY